MKKLLFIFALAILLSACDTSTPTSQETSPQPTDTPTPTIHWQDVATYNGNGNAHSGTFTVPAHWKMKWSCDPNSDKYSVYNFIVYKKKVPYNGDTTIPYADVNAVCSTGNTSGEVEETGAGSYYLEIDINDAWTITIQKPA